jgi:cellulose synthase/poly-beta-1,6-N-acetylglucosamine synthase-like glycosyltransferase
LCYLQEFKIEHCCVILIPIVRGSLVRHTIMQLIIVSISLVLFICYAALIIYYRQSWLKIPSYIPGENPSPTIKISVIIPARNEEKNIVACLDAVCNQTLTKELYEIIVVDDHSTDATAAIVKTYETKNVKLISLKDFIPSQTTNAYKKKAIETAIAQSTGDLIVTTDADCIVTKDWLDTIKDFYHETNAVFIAMPVSYRCSNRFIEIFQCLDFMTLQGITGAAVFRRIHSMCNGANIAYSKKAYYEAGGFAGIDNIASGDDMLLMHKIWKQHSDAVYFLQSKKVIVQTQPQKTIKDFFNQRIRWASKADKYDDKRIFWVLVLVYFFNVLMLLLPIVSIFHPDSYRNQLSLPVAIGINFQLSLFHFWLTLLIGKTIIELFFLYPVAKFFNQQKLLWWFPVAQPFHIFYTVIAGWLGKFGSYRWKERNVK